MVGRTRILVTTSHRPTQRVRSFVKDLASVLPYAERLTRGKATLRDLYYEAAGRGAERILIVATRRGNPGVIVVYRVHEAPLEVEAGSPPGLSRLAALSIRGVILRREFPGSQKPPPLVRSLGVDARGLEGVAARVADTLSRAFLAKLVLSDEDVSSVDVLAKVRVDADSVTVIFIRPDSERVCGPVLKLKGVADYEAGFRVYRGEVEGEEAS